MIKRGLLLGVVVLFILLVIGFISAEKIEISLNDEGSYIPGDNIKFKITLYDDNLNKIDGDVGFIIKNYYKETITSGNAKSGVEVNYKLPENSIRGLWEISAKYKDTEQTLNFNVLELEKADFKIEGDKLIITNVGNVPYGKQITISIGKDKETILVPLGFNGVKRESKTIRLTAPAGDYEVRVNDGTQKEDNIVSSGISLTGNVVGVENPGGGFWKENKIVTMFLFSLALVVVIIIGLNIYPRYF